MEDNSKQSVQTTTADFGSACPTAARSSGAVAGGSGATEAAPAANLGNATEKQSPPPVKCFTRPDLETGEVARIGNLSGSELKVLARRLAYDLQSESSKILYMYHGDNTPKNTKGYDVHHRTCTCERFSLGGDVHLKKSVKYKKVMAGNVMRCANSKTCPVCARPLAERKANEMRLAANLASAKGVFFSMLTLTIPHCSADKITDLAPMISKASSHFWAGKVMDKLRKKYGIVGNIRSFEVRYGRNGWHPHFHFIVVSQIPLPTTLIDESKKFRSVLDVDSQHDDWQRFLRLWSNACSRAGLGVPNENGLDIQNGENAGEYITKFGSDDEILTTSKGKQITWDLMDEMTKGHYKMGRKKSLSPWDLLSISSGVVNEEWKDLEPAEAKKLFLFYARGTAKIHTLRWSRGLRLFFGLSDKQPTDEEILAKEEDSALFLCSITSAEWRSIVKKGHQALVFELAENGGLEAISEYLKVNLDDLISRIDLSEKDDVVTESLAFAKLNHTKTARKVRKREKAEKSLVVSESESHLDSDDFYKIRNKTFYDNEEKRLLHWFEKAGG